MKIKTKNVISLFLLLLSSFLIYIILNFNIESSIYYFFLILLITLSILFSSDFKFLTANSLFTFFFLYTVGLGPIVLLNKNIILNYNYFSVICGGLLAFAWGNFISNNLKKYEFKKDSTSIFRFNISRKYILVLLYLISIVATFIYIYINKQYLFGGNINSGRINAMSGSGILLYTLQLPILIIPMMYDLYFYGKKNNDKIVSRNVLFLMTIISSVLLLFTGFRAPLVTLYICLAIVIIEKNNISNRKIVIFGIFMILLVESLGIVRTNLSGNNIKISDFINTLSTSLYVNCLNLKYIFNTFPSSVPYQHGYTYLINFLMLLPGPDLDFTLWLKEQLNISFSGGGVTPTILGEFFINFGPSSIYIGMFFLSFIGNVITKYFYQYKKNFLGSFYVWQFAHCASGGIANVIILVILYTLIYWILMMFPLSKRKDIKYE